MKIIKSDSVKGMYTVAIASGKLPDFFDSIRYDGATATVVNCYDYGENAFAVKGKHELTGKNIEFIWNGKVVG